jgi:hypothetical protein
LNQIALYHLYILEKKKLWVKLFSDNDIVLEIRFREQPFDEVVQIEEAPEIEQFYNSKEMKKIKQEILSPRFYLIHFKEIEGINKIIKYLADQNDVLIDNDFGLVTTGKKFIKILAEKPGWDWIE